MPVDRRRRARHADAGSRRVRRRGHAADEGDRAGAPLRTGGRHGRDSHASPTPQAGDRRRLLPGAPGDRERVSPSARDRHGRRVQLLPDEEPRRARRRRRRDHQRRRRSPTRSAGCATAGRRDRYHHVEAGVNSRLDELQAAVLRARLPLLRGMDRAAPRTRGALPARICRRRAHRFASATPATSTICFPVRSARTRGAAGAPARPASRR